MIEKNHLSPYRIRTDYLSKDEKEYYRFLLKNFSAQYIILAKVALSDLFIVIKPNENVQFAQRLQKKNLDFLFLATEELKPVLAVELDDPKQDVHQTNSKFIDEVCTAAALSLLHTVISPVYSTADIEESLSSVKQNSEKISEVDKEFSPICPNCGLTMVLRFDKDGPINGQKYYGCLNYPACTEKIMVSSTMNISEIK